MIRLKSHKRGDTFAFYANITDDAGNPYTGPASNIHCQVRNYADVLMATLNVSATEDQGKYLFQADSTGEWPAGTNLYMDIEINDNGVISSSDTIAIPVIKDVTRNE